MVMNIEEIMAALPHRYPFLLVDRVLEIKKGEYIKAIKMVSMNEPHFPGHFPGNPIMPGVMILEAMAQAATCLAVKSEEGAGGKILPLFAGVEKARFKAPVRPGDVLVLEVTVSRRRGYLWWLECVGTVDGKVVCKADIQAALQTIE
ncbi:MAG: 3-hydroxyacyl-ACP dehydratase FabZ [Nitrospinota bacterium]|nr:3-hydroxyacyl-ACP dehydratase FabZ [Nitrospinota bacterium]